MPGRRERATRDRVEIGEVLQRYGLALDEKDFDLLDEVFTPDARLRYAMPSPPGGEPPPAAEGGLAQWKAIFRGFLAPFYWTQHLVSPPVVELEGDRARSTCRLLASHVQVRRADGGRQLWTVYGVYRDEWLRTAGGWRIARRSFQGVHQEGAMLPADAAEHFDRPPAPWRGGEAAG